MENGGMNVLLSIAKKAGAAILKTVVKWLASLLGPWIIVLIVIAVLITGIFGAIASGDFTVNGKPGDSTNENYIRPYKDWANKVNPPVTSSDGGDVGAANDPYALDWGIMYAIDTLGNNNPMDKSTLESHAEGMAEMLKPIYYYKQITITTTTTNSNGSTTTTSTIQVLDKVSTYQGWYYYHYDMVTSTATVGQGTVTTTRPQVSGIDHTDDYTRLDEAIKKYARMKTVMGSDRTMVLQLASGLNQQQQNLNWIFGGSTYNVDAGAYVAGIPANLMAAFNKAGQIYNIPPTVLMAIADVESTFRPDAVGPLCADGQRAEGLMQFKPSTWKWMGVDGDGDGKVNIFDPIDQIFSAAHYLNYLNGITGNLQTSVMDYGEGTTAYRDKVMGLAAQYQKQQVTPSANQKGYDWPLPESNMTITQQFGEPDGTPNGHDGTDIAAAVGTPIYAVISGTIYQLGNESTDAKGGNSIMLKGVDGNIWYYAHLNGFNCKVGDTVNAGQVIGYTGMTGNTTGPHLHFGLMIDGHWYDPMTRYQK